MYTVRDALSSMKSIIGMKARNVYSLNGVWKVFDFSRVGKVASSNRVNEDSSFSKLKTKVEHLIAA